MKRIIKFFGIASVTLVLAACQSTGSFSALSSISEECRTAYNCGETATTSTATAETKSRVYAKEGRSDKAEKAFDYSLRK